jgi:hypothetical protein
VKANVETRISRVKVQGLKPGACKLWASTAFNVYSPTEGSTSTTSQFSRSKYASACWLLLPLPGTTRHGLSATRRMHEHPPPPHHSVAAAASATHPDAVVQVAFERHI